MADFSVFVQIAPVIAYLLVALVIGAILYKTELLKGSPWIAVFITLGIASLFIAFAGVVDFVQTVVPWFAVLVFCLFLLFVMIGFVGKDADFMKKGIGIAAVIILGLIFLVSAFFVFSDFFISYLPGPGYGYDADPKALYFTDWLYSPRVFGAILLLGVSALVAWVLFKSK